MSTDENVYCSCGVRVRVSSMSCMSTPALKLWFDRRYVKLSTTWKIRWLKSNPASWAPEYGPPKGTLVIVGGGGRPQAILDAFLTAAGGKGGVVGVVPTSTSDPEGALKDWKEDLERAGLVFVALDVRARAQASDPTLLDRARSCTGFWFSGGDQNRVGDFIVGTPSR